MDNISDYLCNNPAVYDIVLADNINISEFIINKIDFIYVQISY